MLGYFLCALASPKDGKSSGLGSREVGKFGGSPAVVLVVQFEVLVFVVLLGKQSVGRRWPWAGA
jgi:hypothetical protein